MSQHKVIGLTRGNTGFIIADTTNPEQVIRDLIAYSNGNQSKADAISESVHVYNPGLPNGEAHSRDQKDEYRR